MLARPTQGRSAQGGAEGQLGLTLMMMMMVAVAVVAEAASVEEVESEESEEVLEEEEILVRNKGHFLVFSETSLELTREPLTSDLSRVSPLSSWLIFRRNSNKGENRRTKGTRRTSKHGLPGPPGPPGPQGPRGPPGHTAPLLPQQQMVLQELQLRLKDMEGVCFQCDATPRVSTSFLGRLLRDVVVPRRSLLELQPFSQPSDSERSIQRGRSFNSSSGRFTAAVSGFYQLTASLLIESGDRVHARPRDSVRAAVCIESLCQSNLSVDSVVGVAAAGGTFSILLTGTLHLQAAEYVSVFVDNSSGSALSVLQDSLFSGILLGV